jgi:hypothetical protein
MHHTLRYLLMVLLISVLGCQPSPPPPQPADHSPPPPPLPTSVAAQKYENPSAGISFSYPGNWKMQPASATEVKFDAPASGSSKAELVFDVPTLPAHIPNMIPIDAVRNGYVDDYKKKVPGAQATNLPDPTVPDARQHRVKLTGQQNGASVINEAVTLVHGDHVYILSIDCDDKSYPAAKAALDQAVQSVAWSK